MFSSPPLAPDIENKRFKSSAPGKSSDYCYLGRHVEKLDTYCSYWSFALIDLDPVAIKKTKTTQTKQTKYKKSPSINPQAAGISKISISISTSISSISKCSTSKIP